MSTPGRPKSEFRSAQHEGTPVSQRTAARSRLTPLGGGRKATWGLT